jgi:hypothetical protein
MKNELLTRPSETRTNTDISEIPSTKTQLSDSNLDQIRKSLSQNFNQDGSQTQPALLEARFIATQLDQLIDPELTQRLFNGERVIAPNGVDALYDNDFNLIRLRHGEHPNTRLVNIHLNENRQEVIKIYDVRPTSLPLEQSTYRPFIDAGFLTSSQAERLSTSPLLQVMKYPDESDLISGAPDLISGAPDLISGAPDLISGARNDSFWERPTYQDPEAFFSNNPDLYRRRVPRELNASEMVSQLSRITPNFPSNTVRLGEIPFDQKAIGILEDGLRRDEKFYQRTNQALDALRNIDNILFIGYSGHSFPLAAALADHGIRSSYHLPTLNERNFNAMRDWLPHLQEQSYREELNSSAIMLEANHGMDSPINTQTLPNASELLNRQMNNIVIFTEQAPGTYSLDDFRRNSTNPEIVQYLENLQANGISLTFVGTEPNP